MSKRIGDIGERLTFQELNKLGYAPEFGKRGKQADIVCKGTQIEVKTARQGKDGKWRFTLYKEGSQDHHKAHIVLLCALLTTGCEVWFAIPIARIAHKNHAVITSDPRTYGGKLAHFRLSSFEDISTLI